MKFGQVEVAPDTPDAEDQFGLVMARARLMATVTFYEKDSPIYREGEPADNVYQVINGAARATKHLSDGRRLIGDFYFPGDIFGLNSNTCDGFAAEAVIDTTVRSVKRRRLESVAHLDAQIAFQLWKISAAKLRRAEDHMLMLGQKSASRRVAAFLLAMDHRRLATTGTMALPMGRLDIGDYLGLTFETISRVLSKFLNEEIIGFAESSRDIVLLNRERLGSLYAARGTRKTCFRRYADRSGPLSNNSQKLPDYGGPQSDGAIFSGMTN